MSSAVRDLAARGWRKAVLPLPHNTALVRQLREYLAGRTGLLVHGGARTTRWVAATLGAHRDPTHIAVLCDPFLRYGSAQAIGLQQVGLDVTLYYVDRSNEFGGDENERAQLLDRVRAAGVDLVPLPRRRIRSIVKDILWLHRDLGRRQIGAAVVQWHYDPRYATVGLAFPVALVVHDPKPHSGDLLSTFPLPARAISRTAELTSACLIVHSANLFQQIRPLLRRLPIGVVQHGADMAPQPSPVPHERRLLIFGRLFAYKGVDTALTAFGLLPPEMADVKLVVAGRGPLASLARGQHNVDVLEGYVGETDVDTLLGGARLVLLPYKDATQSGVGLQAVARGVPCIVSSEGGLPELVQDSSSTLVVPSDDPQRLAEAIIAHIDHGDELRSAIYSHATTYFAWPVVAQKLYCELTRLGLLPSASAGDKTSLDDQSPLSL